MNELRVGVRFMNEVRGSVEMVQALDKTFIGRISKGFDFLGSHRDDQAAQGVTLAEQTGLNHLDKLNRLYERAAAEEAVGRYVRWWSGWVGERRFGLSKPSLKNDRLRPSTVTQRSVGLIR